VKSISYKLEVRSTKFETNPNADTHASDRRDQERQIQNRIVVSIQLEWWGKAPPYKTIEFCKRSAMNNPADPSRFGPAIVVEPLF